MILCPLCSSVPLCCLQNYCSCVQNYIRPFTHLNFVSRVGRVSNRPLLLLQCLLTLKRRNRLFAVDGERLEGLITSFSFHRSTSRINLVPLSNLGALYAQRVPCVNISRLGWMPPGHTHTHTHLTGQVMDIGVAEQVCTPLQCCHIVVLWVWGECVLVCARVRETPGGGSEGLLRARASSPLIAAMRGAPPTAHSCCCRTVII